MLSGQRISLGRPGRSARPPSISGSLHQQPNDGSNGMFRQAWRAAAAAECAKKTLTRAEKREIAVLLGTPGQLGKGSRYWRSIDEALEFHPQKKHLRQLVTKSKMQHRTLHDTLVTECKDLLKWGNLHRRDTLPDTTLKNRQRAAAQWRGDIPMWVASHRSVRAFGDDDVVGHPDHGEKHLFWDDPPGMAEFIYSKLTFMFDAYTTDNKEGAAAQPELGYISKTDAYAPEPAAAGMALSQN